MLRRNIYNSIWLIIRRLGLGGIMLQIHPKSYLKRRGWFRSFSALRSIDINGDPIPWWSYGVIDFVDERLNKDISVLEFGSGGSTIWLAARTSVVVSIENDQKWAEIVRTLLPSNANLIYLSKPDELEAKHFPDDAKGIFDLVIVDPLYDRIGCAKRGLEFLSPTGVVLWDNTDGQDWPIIKQLMHEHGFKEISFSGLPPQEVSESRTTIFYRENNCFGI